MDFKLENANLNFVEKNKKLFTDMTKDTISDQIDSCQEDADTFKKYSEFMSEKNGLIEVIKEMVEFSIIQCEENDIETTIKIVNLKNIRKLSDMLDFRNKVIMILENYQEQPGLIDPILGVIVPIIMNNSLFLIEYLRKKNNEKIFICLQCLYQIIYILCKIRGFSTIIKFFNSEVYVFEPVINFLLITNCEISENWLLIYVLLLWISILGLIPFDIETIDTNGIITSGLFEYLKKSLTLSGVLRDVSAYTLSKFISRPDVIKTGLLDNFFQYSVTSLHDLKTSIFVNLGIVSALCEIFKNGLAKDLVKYTDFIVENVIKFKYSLSIESSGIFRKFIIKLSQRVGLILLKPKFQKWRYSMKHVILLENLNESSKTDSKDDQFSDEIDELNYDINFELLETIIDHLINSLVDKDQMVRWSSAKGIGRLCERLTKVMVDDILKSIYDLFQNEENEFSWQGACLCIAELTKRGMILPENLAVIVKYLERALIFEVNRGTFCSGAFVRDSACYVVWAFARAYSREIMRPYVSTLARSLILTILFDKEVNCRRAASAAFQEHVGRQGYFPYGIEIITEADYFTLSNRLYCFLNISTYICQYPDYYSTIVDYLSLNRLIHVEQSIRQLTAESLGLLAPFNPIYFIDLISHKLLDLCLSKTLHVRHGAIIGVGYILVGLSGKWDFENKAKKIRKKMIEGLNLSEKKVLEDSDYRKSFENYYNQIKFNNNLDKFTTEDLNRIISIPNSLQKNNLYKGKGAEVMRTAVNNLIRLICESQIVIDKESVIFFFDVLIENLKHANPEIQKEACDALKLLNENYENTLNLIMVEIENKFIHVVKQSVIDESIYTTKGFTMALPHFYNKIIIRNYQDAIDTLFTNSKLKKTNNNDIETRKCSIESLCVLASKFIIKYPDVISQDIEKFLIYCIEGLEDYEIDKKLGDIGSKVREASMRSLTCLLIDLYSSKCEKFIQFFQKYCVIYLNGLLKQLAEKMGRIRLAAGDSLQKFFFEFKDCDFSSFIPCYYELKATFLEDIVFNENYQINNMEWLDPKYGYKRSSPILLLNEYSFRLFEGIIISIGGLTEDVQKSSIEELNNLLKKLDEKTRYNLCDNIYNHIINIFQQNKKNDRVIEPLINTLGYLFTNSYFINNSFLEKIDSIHKYLLNENFESNNIHKVLSSVDVFYNLLYLDPEENFDIFKRCLKSLLVLMVHKYPVVRKKAAEKLYVYLIGVEDPSILKLELDDLDAINILLTEINWGEPISKIKEERNNIAQMLKINIQISNVINK